MREQGRIVRVTVSGALVRAAMLGLVLAMLPAGGCAGGSDGAVEPPATIDELADDLGCEDVDQLEGWPPIRGGAAVSGLACTTPEGMLHLYVRAPERADANRPAHQQGGTLANIDRLLQVSEEATPGCELVVFVAEGYFALGEPAAVAELEAVLGEPVRSTLPAFPDVSYLGNDCDLAAWYDEVYGTTP
jgi:hypothetical protein